jgi:SAM-dependent methyltransferase
MFGFASTALGKVSPQQNRHPFDRQHGVDTSGLIYAEALETGHEHDRESAGYYATAPSLFHRAVQSWNDALDSSGYRLSDYTLVDIGCGKGRVVMMASEYVFRKVVGVELNPCLAKIARKNLRIWMRIRMRSHPQSAHSCPDLRVVKGDALSFPLPDGPVVLFFFNSFEREMVRIWLERLVDAAALRSAPIDLIYVHPEHRELFLQTPGMALLVDEVMAFSEEDAAADVFGVNFDRYAIYRITRAELQCASAVKRCLSGEG